MARKKTNPDQKSGGARIMASGRKPIGVAVSVEEHADLRSAAGLAGLSMAEFVRRAGVEAARKLLKSKGL